MPTARTVCYIEREVFCVAVLVEKMRNKQLDDAPVWSDLTTFDGKPWRGVVDCIIAGFPCPPVSVAGKQLGASDERWLWPELKRIIGEVRPSFVFLENVPGLLSGYGQRFRCLCGWPDRRRWVCCNQQTEPERRILRFWGNCFCGNGGKGVAGTKSDVRKIPRQYRHKSTRRWRGIGNGAMDG